MKKIVIAAVMVAGVAAVAIASIKGTHKKTDTVKRSECSMAEKKECSKSHKCCMMP